MQWRQNLRGALARMLGRVAAVRIVSALLSSALLAGCAPLGLGLPAGGRIQALNPLAELSRAELLAQMRDADVVLLGEIHDNGHHHQARAELLAGLQGSAAVVVAEHLSLGRSVRADAAGAALLGALTEAGFDARGWAWPLHQPLMQAVLRAGLPLRGGNLEREQARQIARQGESATPPELAALLTRAPLGAAAQAALDEAMVRGHCGQLPSSRLPGLRAAQRARDAAMAQAVLQAHAAGGRPVVLLAGNGHVRSDYGVAQLLAAAAPQLRQMSVLLTEPAGDAAPGPVPATHHWVLPAVEREDPCLGMQRLPTPVPRSPSPINR